MVRATTLLKRGLSDLIFALGIIFILFSVLALFGFLEDIFNPIQFIFSPLLVLKMVCSGKYLGLIASFALVYFIHRYRNLKPGIHRDYVKFLVVTGLIIIGIGIFIFYKYPGDWEKRFLDKAQTAKNERAIEDLLDAANTIKGDKHRVEILNRIVMDAGDAANKKFTNHIFKKVIVSTL